MKRIGLLTSGGDCQALNATMRGVVKGLSNNLDELEVYGFMNGYKGLIYGDYRMLTSKDFSGILTRGGTILGIMLIYDGVSSMIVTGRFTRAERDVVDSTAHSVDDTDDFV